MTRQEHLLTIAAEECAEIAQRISKALRFGLFEVQPGQDKDNAERIRLEFVDLCATLEMIELESKCLVGSVSQSECDAKKAKIEQFLGLSAAQGTLVA